MNQEKQKAVIFISGRGSNMESLINACDVPHFPVEIVAVFSDKKDACGLVTAQSRNIETLVFERKEYDNKQEHEDAILTGLENISPDLICLAGYMRILSAFFVSRYENKILNIHPSLLPLFKGLNTHQRALDAGVKIHGCSVHFVTSGMDEGPIIAQACIDVRRDDTQESLAKRLINVEHRLYPHALKLIAQIEMQTKDVLNHTDTMNYGDENIILFSPPLIQS